MTPMNIPKLLDLAGAMIRALPEDNTAFVTHFPVHCTRIHSCLGRAYDGWGPVDPDHIYAAMVEILILSASRDWHLGVAMAEVGTTERDRHESYDVVAEVHAAIGLAFAADLTQPEDKTAPLTFLAVAFRLLLGLCETSGFDPTPAVEAHLTV